MGLEHREGTIQAQLNLSEDAGSVAEATGNVMNYTIDRNPTTLSGVGALIVSVANSLKSPINTVRVRLLAGAAISSLLLEQRGGSLNNIKQNLIQQKKANAKKPMSEEQKKLRRRKRKK